MKSFENSSNNTYYFSSCDICDARCCDGTRGSLFTQIVLEDFKTVAPNFPIVFLIGDQGFIKPVILLSNGAGFCKHLQNYKCSIYHTRPSICKLYPLSPHILNEVHIDTSCPAITNIGEEIIKNGKVSPNFEDPILDDYQDKYVKTIQEFNNYTKDNLEVAITLSGIKFYKFKKDFSNPYLKLHIDSIKQLEENYYNI